MQTNDDIVSLKREVSELRQGLEHTARLQSTALIAAIKALSNIKLLGYVLQQRAPSDTHDRLRTIIEEASTALRDVELAVNAVENAER
jgi:hypothetical protein